MTDQHAQISRTTKNTQRGCCLFWRQRSHRKVRLQSSPHHRLYTKCQAVCPIDTPDNGSSRQDPCTLGISRLACRCRRQPTPFLWLLACRTSSAPVCGALKNATGNTRFPLVPPSPVRTFPLAWHACHTPTNRFPLALYDCFITTRVSRRDTCDDTMSPERWEGNPRGIVRTRFGSQGYRALSPLVTDGKPPGHVAKSSYVERSLRR